MNSLFSYIWAASFAISIFTFNSAVAAEAPMGRWTGYALIFIIPLLLTAIIWVIGRLGEKTSVSLVAWFGVIYSFFYSLIFIFYLVIPTNLIENIGSGVTISILFFPLIASVIGLLFLERKYEKFLGKTLTKKDLIFIFSFMFIGVIYFVQFYGYSLIGRFIT